MVCLVLNGIGAASRQASIAEEKLLALAVAKNEIEKVRVMARDGTIAAASTTTYPADTGIKYPVSVQTVVARIGGSSSFLYSVKSTVTWASNTGPEHSGNVVLETNVVRSQ
jgi:hypothetical protein